MSGFHDSFYRPQYYPIPAAQDRQDDSQPVHDPQGNSMVPPSFMNYPQPDPYDLGHYQNVYDQSSQDPDLFASGTGAALPPTHANDLQVHHQPAGYPMRGDQNPEQRLSNDVNLSSYNQWSDVGASMDMGSHGGNLFSYDVSSTYSLPSSLTSQSMGLSDHPSYSTFPTHSPAENTYWGMGHYQEAPRQDHAVVSRQAPDYQRYPQPYAPHATSQRTLQPRAIQPKPQSTFTDKDRLSSQVKLESSPYDNDNVYSASGFDILGALARVISRPDPKINIGAVDLSCAFVLCDITQDDHPIVYVSEAFGRLTGYMDEEIIGRNCRFLQSPHGYVKSGSERKFVDPSTVLRLRTTIEERSEIQVSMINYRKGGQPFMNLITMIPIRWDSEDYRFYVGFQVDLVEKPDAVTKRNPNGTYTINYQRQQLPNYVVPPPDSYQKHPDLTGLGRDQASAILRSFDLSRPEFKQYLDRILVENADDLIHVLSFDGAFLYLSPSCRRVLEYEPAELMSKPLSYICHPSDIGPVFRDLRASINTAPVSVMYRVRKKHSGYIWFETHGSWHVERGRGRTFLVLVGRERPVYCLSQVVGSESGSLAENDLWAKLSTSGIILYATTKSKPVLGRIPEDLVGTGLSELIGTEYRAEALRALQTARGGRQATFRHQIRHKKGHLIDVQTRLLPGDTEEGTKPSFLVAQIRFPTLAQPTPGLAGNEDSVDATVPPLPGSGDRTDSTSNDPQAFDTPGLTTDHETVSSSSPESPVVLPELAPYRSSSWQFELRELEKHNRVLADEVQRLLAQKRKRKRKQTVLPPGKSCVMCHTRNTPEWRRGPSGNRDLCNSCGLRWAKQPAPPPPPPAPFSPPSSSSASQNGGPGPRAQNRLSGEFRTTTTTTTTTAAPTTTSRPPLPVPSSSSSSSATPTGQNGNGHSRNLSGFDMAARSPPNQSSKDSLFSVLPGFASGILPPDTKHVPCKFFRQGACQAGPACPFLHSTDAAIDYAPCKYFTKGNCKFGAKCALAHILPDGRRVNRPTPGMGMGGGGHLNLGGRVNPQAYVNQDSALTNSVLSQQRMNSQDPRYVSKLPPQEEFAALHAQQQQQQQAPPPPPPAYDTIPTIDAGLASDAGSKYGSPVDDLRFPMSPNNHLTALDAPLPASFDSEGISHAARYGPVAASMPSKFGLELSPPAQRAGAPSDALRNLRDAAYGPDLRKQSLMGSSPPGQPDDAMGPRFLHSQRSVKPRMLSASVPRQAMLDDWDESNFPMEEDYLPINLHDDVLTPQERLRRLSRTDHDLSSSHRDMSGLGMTSSSLGKMGSPLGSSPSRFGALFAKQRQRKEEEGGHGTGTSFPTVGSPLRESSLNLGTSPSLGPIGSRHAGSPARQSSTSMISQQLSNMSLHPGSARHSSSLGASGRLDRAVSSPVNTSTIDEEEQSDLVFSMEEEENNKRNSASWNPDKEDSTDEGQSQLS